jgi:hypothetical protein
MNVRPILLVPLLAAVTVACSPSSRTDVPPKLSSLASRAYSAPAARVRTPAARVRADSAVIDAQLAVTIADDAVDLALQVRNDGGRRAEVKFPNGQTHDFIVLDSLGREAWRWSDGRLFTQTVRNRHLNSGDSFTITERWTSPAPGSYTIVARLRSVNYPAEVRTPLLLR